MSFAPLLADVLARPDDDAPRLAYAVAVAGEDPERAELIRVQCEWAGLGTRDAHRETLAARATELVDANYGRWLGGAAEGIERPVFERGFLAGVHLSISRPIDPVAELLKTHQVRTLYIEDRLEGEELDDEARACLEGWAACPALANLVTIDGGEEILGAEGWCILLASRHLANLRSLVISDADSTGATVTVIAAASHLRLESLRMMGWMSASLGDAGVECLASAPHLASLRHLSLWNCDIHADGARAIAVSPHLCDLETLLLGSGNYSLNKIGPDGARALADSANFRHLTDLDLGFNGIGDDGGQALVESTAFPALERLYLQADDLTNVTVRAFQSAHERFPSMRGVDLSHNAIDGGGIWSFVRAPVFRQLEFLWLYHNQVGDDGVAELIQGLANRPCALKELNLTQNPISADGVEQTLAAPEFDQLERLYLGHLGMDDAQKQRLRDRFGPRLLAT